MYILLELIGSGEEGDSWRVDLPNYAEYSLDFPSRTDMVIVGTGDSPPSLPTKGTPLYPLQNGKYVLIGLDPDQLTSWWAKLATRYPLQDPPYMPNFP